MDLLERQDALQAAVAVLERASAGRGGVLLVSGEAGIGKSALVGELSQQAQPVFRVLRGHCEDLYAPRVLGPLHDMAASLGDAARAALDEAAPAAARFARLLSEFDTPLRPALMVIEDLHWADQATLDFVKFMGRRIGGLPLVLLMSLRDDALATDGALGQVLGELPPDSTTRLPLAPLSAAGVAELAARAGRPAQGLHAATAGNPFYVTELLASGVAELDRGLPTSVRLAVLARLARLPAAERELLDRLSVVPGWLPLWLAQALAAQAGAAALDACLSRGVLVLGDTGLAFRHELARRAVADALPPLRRRELHARAFEALSASPAGVSVALPARVHHAAEAGDATQVLALAPLAGAEAAGQGAHREAALLYGVALRFAGQAPAGQRAQLNESWSYEAGLALHIDASVIEARHRAIALWREAGRADKVGHNLRWLSRLHWYRGDQALAERFADEAVTVLQPLPPGPELAWALSMRSQQFMLQDRTDLAIDWGERAIALAESLGEKEILCHALNNVGTALLFADRPGGRDKLEQSLALALEGGFHEQAARVYTNLSEHAVVFKDFERAERLLEEGIAFDRRHDLDAWTHYLVGWLAELQLARGRFEEAGRIAGEVLALPHLTLVMRLPAQTVLARVQMRRGAVEGERLLAETLALAQSTGEAQRIVPLALALAEGAWLRADLEACQRALQILPPTAGACDNPWEAGEIAAWHARAGLPMARPRQAALPWVDELDGRWRQAADAWLALGAPYEAALALLQAPVAAGSDDAAAAAWREALQILEELGAAPALACCRALARRHGIPLPAARRGPYGAARQHPHQLTAREQQVLALLVDGRRNAEIAAQLGVTPRTAERHVSEVITKLGASDRHEAVAIARRHRGAG